jgi:hypothetical protein
VLFGTALKEPRRREAESGTCSLILLRFKCFVTFLRAVGPVDFFSQELVRHWKTETFADGFLLRFANVLASRQVECTHSDMGESATCRQI